MLQFSEKDAHHRGENKALSNQVVATLPSGEQRVIFPTTDPADVGEAMRRAVEWYNDTLSIGQIDELLPEVSRNTLKYDLAKLTDADLLRRRGTVYGKS